MSCYICGRGNCTPCFHPIEEQLAYSDAEDAYDAFIEAREQCRTDYAHEEEDEVIDE